LKRDIEMKNRTVLYIEDEKNIRESTANYLKKKYQKVIAVDNCEEALDLYEENPIDIIITDIYIDAPNRMDGLEMVKLIRKNDKYTPILITTAYGEQENYMRAVDLHLEGFLVKVFSRTELDNKLFQIDVVLLEREKNEKRKIKEIEERIRNEIRGKQNIIKISDTITYDPNNLMLIKNDIQVQLTHSENRLLSLLSQYKNQLVHFETIDNEFYDKGISLRALIHVLQKKLGKNKFNKNFIKSVSKEGYKLLC